MFDAIKKCLAKNFMSVVFAGTDKSIDSAEALKFVRAEAESREKMRLIAVLGDNAQEPGFEAMTTLKNSLDDSLLRPWTSHSGSLH